MYSSPTCSFVRVCVCVQAFHAYCIQDHMCALHATTLATLPAALLTVTHTMQQHSTLAACSPTCLLSHRLGKPRAHIRSSIRATTLPFVLHSHFTIRPKTDNFISARPLLACWNKLNARQHHWLQQPVNGGGTPHCYNIVFVVVVVVIIVICYCCFQCLLMFWFSCSQVLFVLFLCYLLLFGWTRYVPLVNKRGRIPLVTSRKFYWCTTWTGNWWLIVTICC